MPDSSFSLNVFVSGLTSLYFKSINSSDVGKRSSLEDSFESFGISFSLIASAISTDRSLLFNPCFLIRFCTCSEFNIMPWRFLSNLAISSSFPSTSLSLPIIFSAKESWSMAYFPPASMRASAESSLFPFMGDLSCFFAIGFSSKSNPPCAGAALSLGSTHTVIWKVFPPRVIILFSGTRCDPFRAFSINASVVFLFTRIIII